MLLKLELSLVELMLVRITRYVPNQGYICLGGRFN